MLEVISFDARDPLSVVDNFSPGLDQRVKYDVTKEVDNAYSSKSVSFLRQDSFAVKRKNLCLSRTNKKHNLLAHFCEVIKFNTYLPRLEA